MLHTSRRAREHSNSAILITGSARSGTTIVGKIVHSFAGVEYAYEPPMLCTLFALLDELSPSSWQLLYETYLYEEFLINALAGRSINCNRSDDSSIYNVKDSQDITERTSRSLSKTEAEVLANKSTLAYKMPDIVPFVPRVVSMYPGLRVIITLRNAADTISSLLARRWFNVSNERWNLMWPFRIWNNVYVPFWVQESDDELWAALPELDRAAYYYIRVNECVADIPNRIEVRYSALVANPKETVAVLSAKLFLGFGPKTESVLRSITPRPSKKNQVDLSQIDRKFRDRVRHFSEIAEIED